MDFKNEVAFLEQDDQYKMVWSNSVIYPGLTEDDKVRVSVIQAQRGQLLDRNGRMLAGKGVASSVVTEFIPKDENNYTITCKIVEQNETIFEVSVYAASREKAKQISDNWKSNATTLYPKILELLSNNKDGANINE